MSSGNARAGLPGGYKREYYGGGLMLLLGVGAVLKGLDYRVGSLTEMGSGFFPVTLGVILACIGVLIAGTAKRPSGRVAIHDEVADEVDRPEWRGWICILGGIAAFAILGKWGGLLPATFAISFISALGDRDNSLRSSFILAVAISVISVVIFWWALQVQFPLFTWG